MFDAFVSIDPFEIFGTDVQFLAVRSSTARAHRTRILP